MHRMIKGGYLMDDEEKIMRVDTFLTIDPIEPFENRKIEKTNEYKSIQSKKLYLITDMPNCLCLPGEEYPKSIKDKRKKYFAKLEKEIHELIKKIEKEINISDIEDIEDIKLDIQARLEIIAVEKCEPRFSQEKVLGCNKLLIPCQIEERKEEIKKSIAIEESINPNNFKEQLFISKLEKEIYELIKKLGPANDSNVIENIRIDIQARLELIEELSKKQTNGKIKKHVL